MAFGLISNKKKPRRMSRAGVEPLVSNLSFPVLHHPAQAMTAIYDILLDDRRLRQIVKQPRDQRGIFFDTLRKNYPIRREAHNTCVAHCDVKPDLLENLRLLGFRVV